MEPHPFLGKFIDFSLGVPLDHAGMEDSKYE
jgi:hypothetical protein